MDDNIIPERKHCDYIFKNTTAKQTKGEKCGKLCIYDRTRCSRHVDKTLNYQKKYYEDNRERYKQNYDKNREKYRRKYYESRKNKDNNVKNIDKNDKNNKGDKNDKNDKNDKSEIKH